MKFPAVERHLLDSQDRTSHTHIILNIGTKRERSHEGRVHLKFLLNSLQALRVWPRPNAPRLSRLPSPLFIW